MAETIVTPSGPGAIEAGLMIDEAGERFVVLTFKEEGGDPTLVTFTVPLFAGFARLLQRTAEAAADEANWAVED